MYKISVQLISIQPMKKDHYTHLLCRCAGMLLLMLYAPWVLAQNNVSVKGKVTSQENNSALPGVNVVVKGTTVGTATDAEGNYTISAPANSTLVFSFIGFVNEEVAIGNRTTIDIALAPDIKALSEVVVIGYGEREKKDLTGSISTVGAKEIEKSVAIQPELALQGRAAGVFVSTPGGNPNARPQVRIRGVGTFNFAEPLYVVDGVPITEFGNTQVGGVESDLRGNVNILNLINPADIESISVLKDAAAAAIYGVRASNGVILITTKKGKQGKPRVEVTASRGIQNLRKTYEMLNVPEFVALNQEAADNAKQKYNPVFDPTNSAYLGNRPTTDWQTPLINRNALLEDYSVKLSGGSEATTYYVSGGYSKTESPLVENDLKRYTLALNVNSKINKYLSAGITYRLGYVDALDNTQTDLGYLSRTPPWQPIYDPNGVNGFAPSANVTFKPNPDYDPNSQTGGHPFTVDATTMLWGPQTRANMFAQQSLRHNKYYVLRNMGTSFLQVEPLPGLRVKGTLSIDWFYNRRNDFTSFNSYLFSQTPGNPYEGNDGTAAGTYGERHSRNLNLVKEFSVNYGRAFGNHNIDLLFNAMDQEYGFQMIGGSSPVASADRQTWGIGSPYNRYVGSGTWRDRYTLQGYLGRLSYNFNNKYYVDATLRRDGTSRFAPGYKWGTFPAVAVAWRISSENFMQNLPFLNDLKIRAGWGQLGNQETATFAYASTVSTSPDYALGSGNGNSGGVKVPGVSLSDIPVIDLSWETATTTNIGFDASMLGNKLTLTAEYYRRTTADILQRAGLTPSFGVQNRPGGTGDLNDPVLNIATVRNSGIELQAAYNGNIGDFTYSLSGNLTTVRNRVLKLFGNLPFGRERGRVEVGQSMFYLWGYKVGGIFQDSTQVENYQNEYDVTSEQPRDVPSGGNQNPGDIWFQDLNSPRDPNVRGQQYTPGADGRVTIDDRTFLGKTIPGYYYGFNLGAGYKGIDISVFFQGVGDVKKFNEERADGEQMSAIGINQWKTTLERFTAGRPSTTMPRAVIDDPGKNNRFSDRFIENAGFLRLKNLQVGYSLPKPFLTRLGFLDNFRVYVSATNLLTFTKWTGLDPETINLDPRVSNNDAGYRTPVIPPTRSFVVGVNAAF